MKKKLHFTIAIQAPAATVYENMLGLNDRANYEQWTAFFNPTSTYEGTWEEGTKMFFIGVDEKGQKGGIVSRIAENRRNEYVSIHHLGLFQAGVEMTEGPEVEKWANGFENYSFKENNGTTTISVDLDVPTDFEAYMNETYPKALAKLKEICEG